MRDGEPYRPAAFVVNGHSVCQRHVHVTIRTRGQSPLFYTWQPGSDIDEEPRLEALGEM
ncbi:hypothetical protein FHT44_005187 [Mycolicibacterium sp. BK634]|nr:hypothetical protein [Mycolicibacterium sp. BK634]